MNGRCQAVCANVAQSSWLISLVAEIVEGKDDGKWTDTPQQTVPGYNLVRSIYTRKFRQESVGEQKQNKIPLCIQHKFVGRITQFDVPP